MPFTTFEHMPVWQHSITLATVVFDITKTLPRSEDYGLTSQIRRAALSISGNIAEGFGRESALDKRRFYIIAKGSLLETKSHYLYGCRVAYFSENKALLESMDQIHHELNKLIKTIKP